MQMYHVSKSYDKNCHVLCDVNLEIKKGDFVFIAGASGAGKTTLIKLLLREEVVSEGQILILGRNLRKVPQSNIYLLRREIGVVFQDFKLLKDRTIFENIDLVLQLLGLPKIIREKRVFSCLKMVGLEKKISSYPQKLSGGEMQRAAIARAMANNPSLILADEPTGNLDAKMAKEMIDLFHRINIMGTTIMIVTHQISLEEQMGKRYLKLEAGKICEN
ncbi:MAG TPA: ATP-binding cassette domain-containing protein [Candidatus Paceibacterota bacterium]|nr:ATP-binding cassette domain-containing protein [Candidatus Paceibacterota bacterium]